ncbi:MAG: hypothetical protein JRN27_03810 [Nitrososphaerota archaeon]|nr:hypothetical protein [Nitrososphaerota archaeon]MDG6975205.1 hypothetical protein [Nitrososphaerota archaeon]MDG7010061.1 hypothetical protein [Nitrososphaerota archaeon]MDG7019501.1 hypothetical protein [Nitrososphaerota archaeon]
MPASSIGAMSSWALYIAAAAALLLVLSPALMSTASGARAAADWRTADGVRAVLDSMLPGIRVRFSFGAAQGSDVITLSGRTVAVSYGSGTFSFRTRWELANATLDPAEGYLALFEGGVIEVVPGG